MTWRALGAVGVCGMAGVACAAVIGVGLDWRQEVFVQEVWEGDVPRYLVFSRRENEVELTVHRHQGGEQIVGWRVPPKTLVRFDAKELIGKGLIEFRMKGGNSLGLLEAPNRGKWKGDEKGTMSSCGLNGSGGRPADVWVEQPATVRAGETCVLKVSVPSGGSCLWTKERNDIVSISSETLTVQDLKDRYEIDATKPAKEAERHEILVTVRAPKTAPALLIVDGWRWTEPKKSGHGITRGIVVVSEPAREK